MFPTSHRSVPAQYHVSPLTARLAADHARLSTFRRALDKIARSKADRIVERLAAFPDERATFTERVTMDRARHSRAMLAAAYEVADVARLNEDGNRLPRRRRR